MKEHPITFPETMVRALLERRKTQMRRVVAPPHGYYGQLGWYGLHREGGWWGCDGGPVAYRIPTPDGPGFACPLGAVGDSFWVREVWGDKCFVGLIYKADQEADSPYRRGGVVWRNPGVQIPVHEGVPMLRLTGHKGDPAPAEYLFLGYREPDFIRAHFAAAWDSVNARHGYGWKANPWIWVIAFERMEQRA